MTDPYDELGLIPPTRFGALLREERIKRGLSLTNLGSRSMRFDAAQLERIEAGLFELDDETVQTVAELYAIVVGPVVPGRSRLVIDVPGRLISIGESSIGVKRGRTNDQIMQRYLWLIVALRATPPGAFMPLRTDDLAVLAEALEIRDREVEDRLLEMMSDPGTFRGRGSLLRRLAVPQAGLLCAVTAVGSIVFVQSGAAASPSGSEGAIQDAQLISQHQTTSVATPPTSTATIATTATTATTVVTTTTSTTAPGHLSTVAPAPTSPAEIGAVAEELIDYPFREVLPDWTIEYVTSMPGYGGLTNTQERWIRVRIDPGATPDHVAGILAHEVGHAIDVTHLSDSERSEWQAARGIADHEWWPGSGASDFATGAGDFAEGFAQWQTGAHSHSQVAGQLTAQQAEVMASLVP